MRSHEIVLQAALLAAHGAMERKNGFRPSDVRFFFLLFTNWLEHDVIHPGQDMDLTQIRRVLTRLTAHGWTVLLPVSHLRRLAPRSRRYGVTPAGLLGLAEALTTPPAGGLSLELTLLVVCFCASYREAILSRVKGERHPLPAAARRALEQLLDPRRPVAAARRSLSTVEMDLVQRIEESKALEQAGRQGQQAGYSDSALARSLEEAGAYQLHGVRSLTDLLAALPDDLRRFELRDGIATRRRLLFEPLLKQARAQRKLLDEIQTSLDPLG